MPKTGAKEFSGWSRERSEGCVSGLRRPLCFRVPTSRPSNVFDFPPRERLAQRHNPVRVQ